MPSGVHGAPSQFLTLTPTPSLPIRQRGTLRHREGQTRSDSLASGRGLAREASPAPPRLTQRRSSSGAWAAGWGPHCPGEGMVSGHGSVGCPAAQPKPGGWGAVVAEEDRMTWLTWRGTGGSQGLTPGKEGPRTQLHAHVGESAICSSLAVECRLQLTQPGGHVPANTLACPAGSSACLPWVPQQPWMGLPPPPQLCTEMPADPHDEDARHTPAGTL